MESQKSETVLISLVGTSPGVLTETVWALANEEEPVIPDRVVAVTTSPGRDVLVDRLFTKGGWDALLADLEKQGHDLENKLGFGNIGDSIRVFANRQRTRELDDIRSVEDNEAVAEFLMELVRSFTENESVHLIVSIAGGRKTTSALLHSVVTLLGRAQDRITHVIIDDVWIHPDFLYPGCAGTFENRETGEELNSSEARVDLFDVPFVPLRYLFERDLQQAAGSYNRLIQQIRSRVLNIEDDLEIDLDIASGGVRINGKALQLSPTEFAFYLYFAERAAEGLGRLEVFQDMGDDALKEIGKRYLNMADFDHWSHKLICRFDAGSDAKTFANSIRTKLRAAGFTQLELTRLLPNRGDLRINLPKEAITIS